MTKRRIILDSNQLFGSMNIDGAFREAISQALKRCPLSRYQVAARSQYAVDCKT